MEVVKEYNTVAGRNHKRISEEFGSVHKLYKKIFDLYREDAQLYYESSLLNARMKQIQNELFEIEDKLNAIGINGIEIMGGIMKDEEESARQKNDEEEKMNKIMVEINKHLMIPEVASNR